jgi:hypothetical protein
VTQRESAVAQLRPSPALLLFVHPSSERLVEPVRQDSSFSEKQAPHPTRLLVVQRERLMTLYWHASFSTEMSVEAAHPVC